MRKITSSCCRSRGFTLIQLITVVAIIAVLATILIPAVQGVLVQARLAQAVSNVRQVGMASLMFIADNEGEIAGNGNISYKNSISGEAEVKLAAYLLDMPLASLTWRDFHRAVKGLKDPSIPDSLCWYTSDSPWSWAINENFASWRNGGGFRNISTIPSPDRMIYAASGTYVLLASNLIDESYGTLPATQRNGLYVGYPGKFPAVFLDGHTEVVRFPASRKLVTPDNI